LNPSTQTPPDYYQAHCRTYFRKTATVNPASFLQPLVDRLAPGARILDVGCGSGRDLKWLGQRGFQVTGMERASGLAHLARAHAGCPVMVADYHQFDFSTLTVDAILLIGALAHVSHAALSATLQRILQALGNHGPALITLKHGTGTRSDGAGRRFYLWSDAALRPLFDRLQLTIDYHDVSRSLVSPADEWLSYIVRMN